jgi:hypothetical protein
VKSSVVICLLFVLSTHSFADSRQQARALFDSGMTHYNLREYNQALDDFTSGYRIRHDSAFLFNIAQCHRQLGDADAAAGFYRAYRREAPSGANRDELDRLIAEMERAAIERRARQPPIGTRSPTGAGDETTGDHAATPQPTTPQPTTPQPTTPQPTTPQPTTPPPSASAPPSSPSSIVVSARVPERAARHRRWWPWTTAAGAVVVGVALGVGLGVGLASHPYSYPMVSF